MNPTFTDPKQEQLKKDQEAFAKSIKDSEDKRAKEKKIESVDKGDPKYFDYLTNSIRKAKADYEALESEIKDLNSLLEKKREQRAAASSELEIFNDRFKHELKVGA